MCHQNGQIIVQDIKWLSLVIIKRVKTKLSKKNFCAIH